MIDNKQQSVGILAYGSLISDPGCEIKSAMSNIIYDVMTPFQVEFARSSNGRGGAPTLVPVITGGARVNGKVFVMDLSENEAINALYRREIDKVGTGKTYKRPNKITDKTVVVERLTDFAELDVVLYTKIAATIDPLTAERLASLAIESVARAKPGCDGISYLIAAKEYGIVTALSQGYEAEILRKTGCETLEQALTSISNPA